LRPGAFEKLRDRRFQRAGPAIHLVRDHGVEGLGDGDHPRAQRDLPRPRRLRATLAVVPVGHVLHDLQDLRRGATVAEHLLAHPPRAQHQHPLVGVELGGLGENPIRYADHPHVVQQRGQLDVIAIQR
jgi:hypothetical protein